MKLFGKAEGLVEPEIQRRQKMPDLFFIFCPPDDFVSAMIAHDDDDGVLEESRTAAFREEPLQFLVEVSESCKIAVRFLSEGANGLGRFRHIEGMVHPYSKGGQEKRAATTLQDRETLPQKIQ